MNKLFAGLLALICSAALAQSYPSPTYNNLTVQGIATLTAHPLGVSSGGTNSATASGTALDNISGFSSTGFLTRTGAGAYSFQSLTNGITYGNLAQAGANTLLGNATGSTANVTAVSVTGCNGAAQALQWTNGSGFQCNSTIATSGANANITSLSGLTTALSVSQGGTGRQTLTAHGVLVGEGTAAINQLAVGTTGQVLVGATGADPAFGTTVAGLTFTSAITPTSTGGIVGTTTNDNANAGSIGEYQTNTASGVALTNTVYTNVTTLSLSAGDWDIEGFCAYGGSGTGITASVCGINGVSATNPGSPNSVTQFVSSLSNQITWVSRFSLSGTSTIYLGSQANFTGGSVTVSGWLRARRVR
ncbi:hypothetical protein C6Q14_28345 [Burkholderia ambifaria]|jgi:hypothetical protein|uniref:hypothetical protein n=1 Tax=Burkholderia ambifaria TaxID=152480 RepID=UPI000CFE3F48|nr:hypothetical protein [Burkholderia ambifaria]PRF97454.1 hypothetical protein C6Q14_28345 [Burkholderia ambifaria]